MGGIFGMMVEGRTSGLGGGQSGRKREINTRRGRNRLVNVVTPFVVFIKISFRRIHFSGLILVNMYNGWGVLVTRLFEYYFNKSKRL